MQFHEPYRTLLGHFRHEVGHYYWDRLIKKSARIHAFRELFGDERQHYATALEEYYARGLPQDWQEQFISQYSSSHPWEDWSETWAHYLHMIDTLDTAMACGLALRPRRSDEPILTFARVQSSGEIFDQLIENWIALTYVLNNLNRSMGLPDGYPFVLSPRPIEKLRFVHETIRAASTKLSVR